MRQRLTVVPTRGHVVRFSGQGSVETREALRTRLAATLLPDAAVAEPGFARVLLGSVLPGVLERAGDARLSAVQRRGGRGWLLTLDSFDETLGKLHREGAVPALGRLAREGEGSLFARSLVLAIAALDARFTEAGLVDPRALDARLGEAIARASPAEVVAAVGARTVVAQAIVSWTPGELSWWRSLAEALARSGGRATLEVAAFDLSLDTSRVPGPLEALADHIAAALDDAPSTFAITATLGDMGFAGAPGEIVRGQVEVRQAIDARAEAEAVIDAVHEKLRGGGPPGRIAVVVPEDDRALRRTIVRGLDESGVATATEGRLETDRGAVAFALAALTLLGADYSREKLAAFALSTYLDPSQLLDLPDGPARRALERLARALRSVPAVRSQSVAHELTAAAGAWEVLERDRRREDIPLPAVAGTVADVLTPPGPRTARTEHVEHARSLWARLGISRRVGAAVATTLVSDLPWSPAARAEMRAFARDGRAIEVLERTLLAYAKRVRETGIDDPVSVETFRHEIEWMLRARDPVSQGEPTSAIRITTFEGVAAESLDLLVVAGANEGKLPGAETTSTVVSPGVDTRMRELDGRVQSPRVRVARDWAHLAMAASCASRVVLTYATRDATGTMLSPSSIVSWLERGGATVSTWRASSVPPRPRSERQRRLRALAANPAAAAVASEDRRRADMERRREAFFSGDVPLDAFTGLVPASELSTRILREETGAGDRALAVTSLERFATCPFQGFALEVLGARDRAAHADIPDRREQGSIVHEALAAAFVATRALWQDRPRDAIALRARARSAAEALLRRDASASGLRRIVLDQAIEDVMRVVEWSLEEEEWDFDRAEQRFGDGSVTAWPAVVLGQGDAVVHLRGSIDRVDVAPAGGRIRAIDYKLGESTAKNATAGLGRRTFQLPVYARAAANALETIGLEGLYLPTRSPSVRAGYRPKGHVEAWTRALEEEDGAPRFEGRAVVVVEEVRAGAIPPIPDDPRACELCAYDGGCRKPRFSVGASREDGDEREAER